MWWYTRSCLQRDHLIRESSVNSFLAGPSVHVLFPIPRIRKEYIILWSWCWLADTWKHHASDWLIWFGIPVCGWIVCVSCCTRGNNSAISWWKYMYPMRAYLLIHTGQFVSIIASSSLVILIFIYCVWFVSHGQSVNMSVFTALTCDQDCSWIAPCWVSSNRECLLNVIMLKTRQQNI